MPRGVITPRVYRLQGIHDSLVNKKVPPASLNLSERESREITPPLVGGTVVDTTLLCPMQKGYRNETIYPVRTGKRDL